jgi:hypothetical protein
MYENEFNIADVLPQVTPSKQLYLERDALSVSVQKIESVSPSVMPFLQYLKEPRTMKRKRSPSNMFMTYNV